MIRKDIQNQNSVQLWRDSICFGFVIFVFFFSLNRFTSINFSLPAIYIGVLAFLLHFFIMYETTAISFIQKISCCMVVIVFTLFSASGSMSLLAIQIFVITGLFVLAGGFWYELTRDLEDDE